MWFMQPKNMNHVRPEIIYYYAEKQPLNDGTPQSDRKDKC